MSGVVQGLLGCADSLILLLFADFWPKSSLGDDADFSGYGVDTTYSIGTQNANLTGNSGPMSHCNQKFKNWPVTQSSQQVQDEEEANMAASGQIDVLQDFNTGF